MRTLSSQPCHYLHLCTFIFTIQRFVTTLCPWFLKCSQRQLTKSNFYSRACQSSLQVQIWDWKKLLLGRNIRDTQGPSVQLKCAEGQPSVTVCQRGVRNVDIMEQIGVNACHLRRIHIIGLKIRSSQSSGPHKEKASSIHWFIAAI